MLLTGLEPVWTFGPRDFKSLASADFATTANIVEAPPRIELGMKVLQTSALPLGYGATNVAEYKDWQAYYCLPTMERETRFELATFALARQRSTTEPFPHVPRTIV